MQDQQVALTKAAWARDDANETARIKATADVAIAREKRMAEEAASRRVKYVAMQNIAATSDAGGKAAIAVSLSHEKDAPEAAAPMVAIAPVAPTQVPVFNMPKSTTELWLDFGKSALNSPLFPALVQGAISVVQAQQGTKVAKINADRDATIAVVNGETTRALYASTTQQNANTVAALRDVGLKPVPITTVTNVTGTGNAVNGSTADNSVTTNTAQCPLTQNDSSSVPTTASNTQTPTATSPPSNVANISNTTPRTQSGAVNCTAGK